MTSQLPRAQAPIAGNLPATPEYYRFLDSLQRLQAGTASAADITALQAQIAAIQAEINALPQNAGYPTLQVTAPMYSQGLLQNGFAKIGVFTANSVDASTGKLTLLNDAAAPGNTWFYGTDTTGAKGWQALSGVLHDSARVAITFATDGTATFDLKTLADSGAGTFKLLTRDAYGRLSGTKDGTTDDVPEGSTNLYFTNARAQGAVVASSITDGDTMHSPSGNVVFDALAGKEPSITAGTTAQYWRGDKTWQALDKAAVGLGNVDNTSDLNKPVSTAQAVAIAVKADDSSVMHLAVGDSSHVTSGKYFDGGLSAGAPTDFWAYGNISSNGRSFWGSEGYFGTNGSFAMSFRSNGYRNSSTSWTSLGRGGSAGASGIDMLPTGSVRFGADSAAPTSFDVTWRWEVTTAAFRTYTDNVYSFGDASHRPTVLWAASGTISTSDGREKTDVTPLTDVELAAASDLARAIGTYQWLASITDKGADKARHHAGLTVQHAIEIMQAHGLDPMRYGFICYDKWDATPEVWQDEPEERDAEGTLIQEASRILVQPAREAGDRYSFRPDELNLFLARGFATRLDALEHAMKPGDA